MSCRVCGSLDTRTLPIGKYEEFFRLRVDTSKDQFQLFARADSIQIRKASIPVRALRKIGRMFGPPKRKSPTPFRTYMQSCGSCHAITPYYEYSFDDLMGLYHDYRSETYNRDRISVEPSYAKLAKHVGSHQFEITGRNSAVDNFLNKNLTHFPTGIMIDYGGSDGRFIPSFAYQQFDRIYIYDASSAPLHESVNASKVEKIASPQAQAYSFLTCMHVLEHVGNPMALIAEATQLLIPGGLMYIEVPLELTASTREDFEQKIIDPPLGIHEHMNRFDRITIPCLFATSPNLELIDQEDSILNLGWISGLIGRYLARRTG